MGHIVGVISTSRNAHAAVFFELHTFTESSYKWGKRTGHSGECPVHNLEHVNLHRKLFNSDNANSNFAIFLAQPSHHSGASSHRVRMTSQILTLTLITTLIATLPLTLIDHCPRKGRKLLSGIFLKRMRQLNPSFHPRVFDIPHARK